MVCSNLFRGAQIRQEAEAIKVDKLVLPFAVIAVACILSGCGDPEAPLGEGGYTVFPNASWGKTYEHYGFNTMLDTANETYSTFSIDVGTGSYTFMRRDLNLGYLPNPDGVRVEEYLNYFTYAYPQPIGLHPFAVHLETAKSPYDNNLEILRVGLQGRTVPEVERAAANLVFLIDVSVSMRSDYKLGLIKSGFEILVEKLNAKDTVSVVTYAGHDYESVALEATQGDQHNIILKAINGLKADGGTNGAVGIRRAYDMNEANKIPHGINRVVLCTDGNLNMGLTGEELIELIGDFRDREIYLTTLGFGMSSYHDRDMEMLAHWGNGTYAYVDTKLEARRVFRDKLLNTLHADAKDVEIQLRFSPEYVSKFRLIGYDSRALEHDSFERGRQDPLEFCSRTSVTALYELALTDAVSQANASEKIADVSLRYKQLLSNSNEVLNTSLTADLVGNPFEEASDDFRFAAAVAEFAEILRNSHFSQGVDFDRIVQIVQRTSPNQLERAEFLSLVQRAKVIRVHD